MLARHHRMGSMSRTPHCRLLAVAARSLSSSSNSTSTRSVLRLHSAIPPTRLYSTAHKESSKSSSSFGAIKWLFSIGFVSASVYFGAAWVATKDEQVHQLWISNNVPGGEDALSLTRRIEEKVRQAKIEDIQKAVTDSVDTVTSNAEHAFDLAGRTIHTAIETATSAVDTVTGAVDETIKVATGFVDTASNVADHTINTISRAVDKVSNTASSAMHDAEAVFSSVKSAITGIPSETSSSKTTPTKSTSKATIDSISQPDVKHAVAAAKSVVVSTEKSVKSVAKTVEAVVKTTTEKASDISTQVQALPTVKGSVEKTAEKTVEKIVEKTVEKAAGKTVKGSIKEITEQPVGEKVEKLDEKSSKTPVPVIADTLVEKSEKKLTLSPPADSSEIPVAAKSSVSPDVSSEKMPTDVTLLNPEKLLEIENAIKSLPDHLPALDSFLGVLKNLSHTLDNLVGNSDSTSSEAANLRKARTELDSLTKFVLHLEADEVALVQTALSQQAMIFQHIISNVSESAEKLIAQETTKLESIVASKLAEQHDKLTLAHEEDLGERLMAQMDDFRAALDTDLQRQTESLEKFWSNEVKIRVDQERDGRLARLDQLALKIKHLERISLDAGEGLDRSHRIHLLQSALRALRLAADNPHTTNFSQELNRLKSICDEDEFVNTIIATLPVDISLRYTSASDLVKHLDAIKTPLRRSQLVSDDADALSFALSTFLSYFIVSKHGLVAGNDLESILSRVDYYLVNGRVDDATREMNQLTGWPKRLSHDWLVKARTHLEIQQAIQVLEAHLNLQSLGVL
ncbi:hypothetical protein BASA50_002531 [Batrachochytrium salamandrivorans]|uniref:MICOS complex subunit MIC60 n=1 Tax=Batrachochytrium salamandrivorans TaxID=1357716 RepID=A0ABQ8FP38_9FUNG|nr:hypothetical protein BASA62_009039 [Batrachochytrium salamandrivorans]KAH6578403.1 hypothetical protein BASA60_003641 [Batrachochytrium salamandrivorans]KAH6579051.1 hypothetical protein BASA61_010500 [Batrachochytrium salamandrivorans]KAH6600139.1 hypothetical protein BASA50_002531 [Batrachochytrium salamandrivorans]KAH9254761.1 hypothetical protein BASA81_007179 [Batrachochytrium salamandrivorans]